MIISVRRAIDLSLSRRQAAYSGFYIESFQSYRHYKGNNQILGETQQASDVDALEPPTPQMFW